MNADHIRRVLPRHRASTVSRPLVLLIAATIASSAWPAAATAQNLTPANRNAIGLTALEDLLGASAPTGAGVTAVHVEAALTGGGTNYMPDIANPQLADDIIVDKHGAGTVSTHATSMAQAFYGSQGVAPGVNEIDVFNANSWTYSSFLRTRNWQAPQIASGDVINCSWIGNFGSDNSVSAIDMLRRLDYVVERDQVVMVAGVNNGGSSAFPQILANAYNLIAVGVSSGNSSPGPSTLDVAGRSKPDLVAPAPNTSTATAWVSGAASLLLEAAQGDAAAALPQTIKALLLAGAVKSPLSSWSHTPEQPLDLRYGAGQLNVLNSYSILAAGRQSAGDDVATTGWDVAAVTPEDAAQYYLEIPEGYMAATFSAIATWNRHIQFTQGVSYNPATLTPSLANVDLFLADADSLDEFGNSATIDSSISTIDNVEHIYQTWLPAGRYELSLTTDSDWEAALAWRTELVKLGDANRDGFVDGADYTLWADNYLATDATWEQGDFNRDGIVDGADYTLWADYYHPDVEGESSLIVAAVPEPSTIALAAYGAALLLLVRHLRARLQR